MEGKNIKTKQVRKGKLLEVVSKGKKQAKVTSKGRSTKNLKGKEIQEGGDIRACSPENDYGVSSYYAKFRKARQKKESEQVQNNYEYGDSKDSDYRSAAFQKMRLPRGVITADGKFVSSNVQKRVSASNNSMHSLSLTHVEGRKKKIEISKRQQFSMQRSKCKSVDKIKRHNLSYSKRSLKKKIVKEEKSSKDIKLAKEIKTQIMGLNDGKQISNNSKTTVSYATETEIQSSLGVMMNESSFVHELKEEISREWTNIPKLGKKIKGGETFFKDRARCLTMLSKVCSVLGMKRETYSLTIWYLDQFITRFYYSNIKLVSLGALTLAIKIDDAEMISKFCLEYLYNPERTVKKGSNSQLKKKKQTKDNKEEKSKLSTLINTKIFEEKRGLKEEFTLEQILDFETQIMVKLGFKLTLKTQTYWIDMLTAFWDSYVYENYEGKETLLFRIERQGRNLSFLRQLIEYQLYSMTFYNYCKVGLVLGGIYLLVRLSLQEKREGVVWDQICNFYKISLSKSANILFADQSNINKMFGQFLTLLDLGITDVIECVQLLGRSLGDFLRTEGRRQGVVKEERLAIYQINQELCRIGCQKC